MGIDDEIAVVNLADTIDYEVLLLTIKKYMNEPTELLEVVVQKVETEIKTQFKEISYFYFSIRKVNPPLGIQTAGSEIILEKTYR